jgi:hypothetical protein
MKTSSLVRLNLLLAATAILTPRPAHPSSIELYTSCLLSSSSNRMAFSIRGNLGNIDDISATFVDADNDMMVDGFVMETLAQGVPQGTQRHTFLGVEAGGVTLLAFPIVATNNFGLTAASLLPGVPAGALPLVPMTGQGTIVVTRMNGTPILSIPLMIDPELLSDTYFRNGFESPPANIR